ncbi:BTB/POZ protein [Rhizophagus irregularis DAOM 181602=DAOM 197198]|uniref:Uncharacterized protein n=2 Tax=Rhizophagus irregularis TaxID=588596 RepID=A0A2P4P575_RHIID|nr:hypothetical protein GLOIN_2v1787728 [Rhizophagus irregularis DAOM 181602=DAOM 197198]POG60538.1 hypothetical protein GLOIN_2v1787728 [Rhizophagus irregularis DAOM 181602=DAOM 197198]GBC45147.2 BTB/POZ protein [Rhizophagus irregularis DAOM 181602=DAOM 197198]|eukprot:XP_025167404.1 hypothetical protein GLOIN_2v1787728 [Rhizophagus irregularis DAOM 181602=DAOM 197198]
MEPGFSLWGGFRPWNLKDYLICTDLMAKSPENIFKSFDFTSLPEKSLVSLIKRYDLQMKEIKIWEHVLKMGNYKNPILLLDPTTWSDDDFKIIECNIVF